MSDCSQISAVLTAFQQESLTFSIMEPTGCFWYSIACGNECTQESLVYAITSVPTQTYVVGYAAMWESDVGVAYVPTLILRANVALLSPCFLIRPLLVSIVLLFLVSVPGGCIPKTQTAVLASIRLPRHLAPTRGGLDFTDQSTRQTSPWCGHPGGRGTPRTRMGLPSDRHTNPVIPCRHALSGAPAV